MRPNGATRDLSTCRARSLPAGPTGSKRPCEARLRVVRRTAARVLHPWKRGAMLRHAPAGAARKGPVGSAFWS
jgi:hypothetical protein